jgi:hypothetical protein
MTLDIQALKEKLREYDKSLPKCPKRIERIESALYDCVIDRDDTGPQKSYHPCCRPEGHDGPCSETRLALGWPGYEVLKALIEIAEKAP